MRWTAFCSNTHKCQLQLRMLLLPMRFYYSRKFVVYIDKSAAFWHLGCVVIADVVLPLPFHVVVFYQKYEEHFGDWTFAIVTNTMNNEKHTLVPPSLVLPIRFHQVDVFCIVQRHFLVNTQTVNLRATEEVKFNWCWKLFWFLID